MWQSQIKKSNIVPLRIWSTSLSSTYYSNEFLLRVGTRACFIYATDIMHLCMVWSTWAPSYSTLNWVMHLKCANRIIFDFYLGLQICVEALSGILLVGWYSWFLVSSNWFQPKLLTSNANISTSAAVLAFDDNWCKNLGWNWRNQKSYVEALVVFVGKSFSNRIGSCVLNYVVLSPMQTTTTLNGRCTDGFDGTSAATPLVSGVMALALQAKYILVNNQGGLDNLIFPPQKYL